MRDIDAYEAILDEDKISIWQVGLSHFGEKILEGKEEEKKEGGDLYTYSEEQYKELCYIIGKLDAILPLAVKQFKKQKEAYQKIKAMVQELDEIGE